MVILDFFGGYLNIIHITEEEKKESEKYEDFVSFLSTLEKKYGFRLSDCQWMITETLKVYRYEKREGGQQCLIGAILNTSLLEIRSS